MHPTLTTLLTAIVLFLVWMACDVVCYICYPHLKPYEYLFCVLGVIVAFLPVISEFTRPGDSKSFVRGFLVSGLSLILGMMLVLVFGVGLHLSLGGSL